MDDKPRRGIQSIEIGSRLLVALAAHLKPMPLRDLAREAGISVGKAHPYLVSFVKVGFVTQDAATGMYALGPLALQIGLAKLYQLDPVREAAPLIAQLAASTGQSVAVAVWGNLGPTIVQLVEPVPMHVNLRVGAVMSVRNTATGRLFASCLPPKVVETFLASDAARLALHENKRRSNADFESELAENRRRGLARTIGDPIPGINAFSAPVFDAVGNIVLAITVMGPADSFDTKWDGSVAHALRACCEEVSRQLGFVAARAG
ncbi:IclR family transcriptional regulator [Paraburkholderia caballeronis]|uniref:IclR family transcriptional regulator n=1 Tax=Paraburkholderia caballeronis TaxID=416943 RepID=UPI0010D45E43|nr:IclR family transcriptional regulator [Paraburkholderia caballeronis]TDV39371.1 IclR family transcriptional regulator [Paraburkholderia caballeronis]